MLFDTLLLTECLLPGESSSEGEHRVKIRVQAEKDETILLFSIDDQSNKKKNLRRLLNIPQQNNKICDVLVFYAKGNQRTICFVELKSGNDVGTAKEQVKQTYDFFKNHLQTTPTPLIFTAKAYIKIGGSLPQEHAQYEQELIKAFGKNNVLIDNQEDISNFIRGIIDNSNDKLRGNRKKKGNQR